jgi:hypothetical protein
LKVDVAGLTLRWAVAWFLLSLTGLFLYLVGTAQNFLDSTLADGFRLVRWLAWLGFLGFWCLLLPGIRRQRHRGAALVLGVLNTLLLAFVLFWGAWVYPDSGVLPW